MGFAFITRYRRRQLAAQALGIELGKQPMHDLMPKLEADEKALARYTEAVKAARTTGTDTTPAKPKKAKASRTKEARATKAEATAAISAEHLAAAYAKLMTQQAKAA